MPVITCAHEQTPLGAVLLAADEKGLCGLWFEDARHAPTIPPGPMGDAPAISLARRWLALYFAGDIPAVSVPMHSVGTPFQQAVWQRLLSIPYGERVTYGELAASLSERGRAASPRAVGGAVGRNPISLLIPCHRVVGARGLVGYAGGLERKAALLRLEAKRTGGFNQ